MDHDNLDYYSLLKSHIHLGSVSFDLLEQLFLVLGWKLKSDRESGLAVSRHEGAE